MKWSMRIGTFAGIGVYVHATFLILVAWLAYVHYRAGDSAGAALGGIVFLLALFACIVLHEFGHALTAARFGIRTRDITLLPIGGIARLERMPEEPWQELLVALAGPAVNVAIAGVLFAVVSASGRLTPIETLTVTEGSFIGRLMMVNVFLAVFNMLPAFPMDGGRVLRAALALRMEYSRATQLASSVARGMALVFALLGLFGNPMLIFIALFVWMGASQEAAMWQMRSAVSGIPLERAMITDFRTVAPTDSLAHAASLLLSGAQEDFPVVDGGALVGMLPRADLLAALSRLPGEAPIGGIMRRHVPVADASELIETAIQRLREAAGQTVPVLRQGRLVGLLTAENVGEFISLQAAAGAHPRPGSHG